MSLTFDQSHERALKRLEAAYYDLRKYVSDGFHSDLTSEELQDIKERLNKRIDDLIRLNAIKLEFDE